MTTIDLLRHGEPIGGRRYRGQVDDPLSDKGWDEMWYAVSGEMPWQQIISSPLRRCKDFAESLSDKLQIPIAYDERLMEVGFGVWEGRTADEITTEDPDAINRFYSEPIECRPAGAERLDQFSSRVNAALDQAVTQHREKHLLIVAHAGVIRAILTRIMVAPLASMYRLSISSASISRVVFAEQRPPSIQFHGRQTL